MLDINKIFSNANNGFIQAKEAILETLAYLFVKIYLISIIIVNILIWYISLKIKNYSQDDLIALHYNVDSGINLIGPVKDIFIIPYLGIIIFLLNLILIFSLNKYKNIRFISHLLLLTALLTNIILLAGIASLYFINYQYL